MLGKTIRSQSGQYGFRLGTNKDEEICVLFVLFSEVIIPSTVTESQTLNELHIAISDFKQTTPNSNIKINRQVFSLLNER